LDLASKVFGFGENDDASGIGIEPMSGAGAQWGEGLSEEVLKGVAIVTPTGMHGKWGGFVEDDEGLILMQ
jgi:hypothetical protein